MTLNKLRLQANEKGFTLIELMIVIAIIGILAAIAIPNYISYRDKAFCSAAESDANAVASGLADYFAIPGNQTYDAATNATATNKVVFPGGNDISLSGTNEVTVTEPSTGVYRIRVTDGSTRCPKNYQDGNPKWNGVDKGGIYSITM